MCGNWLLECIEFLFLCVQYNSTERWTKTSCKCIFIESIVSLRVENISHNMEYKWAISIDIRVKVENSLAHTQLFSFEHTWDSFYSHMRVSVRTSTLLFHCKCFICIWREIHTGTISHTHTHARKSIWFSTLNKQGKNWKYSNSVRIFLFGKYETDALDVVVAVGCTSTPYNEWT